MVALASLLLLLVGLPLLAFWVGGRPFWSRLRPGRRGSDEYGDFVRRHGLSTAQLVRIETAIRAGAELTDPAERAAAVDAARMALDARTPRAVGHPHLRTLLLGLAAIWLLGAAWAFVWPLVQGRWGDAPWWLLVHLLPFGIVQQRHVRRLRQAVALNSDDPGGPPSGAGPDGDRPAPDQRE